MLFRSIKEMDYLVKEEKFDEAYQFAKENINLNKEYVESKVKAIL